MNLIRTIKQLLLAIGLALVGFTAQAQTTTNLIFRIQKQEVTGGVSNITDTVNFTWDYATKKDALKIDGLSFAWAQAVAGGSQLGFLQWIRTDVSDRAREYANVKQAADNAALLTKLQSLLLTNPDLLSNADMNNLNTIAAKAP